jgi:hypothetical protein
MCVTLDALFLKYTEIQFGHGYGYLMGRHWPYTWACDENVKGSTFISKNKMHAYFNANFDHIN